MLFCSLLSCCYYFVFLFCRNILSSSSSNLLLSFCHPLRLHHNYFPQRTLFYLPCFPPSPILTYFLLFPAHIFIVSGTFSPFSSCPYIPLAPCLCGRRKSQDKQTGDRGPENVCKRSTKWISRRNKDRTKKKRKRGGKILQ